MNNATAASLLDLLLPDWHRLLQGWAADGRLTAAAQEALMLSGEPPLLRELTRQWAAGDFSSLPPIVLLSSSDMNGAMGAYAISTGTIYLNTDWYVGASRDQVFAVLTEELGHSLDAKLNAVDTQGDEGEYPPLSAKLSARSDPSTSRADSKSVSVSLAGPASMG